MNELVPVKGDSVSVPVTEERQVMLADLETGAFPDRRPPGAKLDQLGKRELVRMLAEGMEDEQVASWLVANRYVLSYTPQAVNYWRHRPEVRAIIANKEHAYFQIGLASKARRVQELSDMAVCLKDEITTVDQDGIRRMRPDVNKQAQAMMVREFTATIDQIGKLVDDPKAQKVDLSVNGSIEHNHKAKNLGMQTTTRQELLAKLKEAQEVIDAEFTQEEELGETIGGKPDWADEEIDELADGLEEEAAA